MFPANHQAIFSQPVKSPVYNLSTCISRCYGPTAEFDTLEAGKLPHILVVDGDVIVDITVLKDRSNLIARRPNEGKTFDQAAL
jgi:hypothetical protein